MSDGNMLNDTKNWIEVHAVTDGEIFPIDEMEDQIFAEKMIGDGYAINPTGEIVYSPIDGKVEQIAQTNHAVYLSLSEDLKLLIHIGLDTIEMKGKGFEANLEKGMSVQVGDPLIKFDSKLIKDEGYNPVIAVVLLNGSGLDFDLTVFPTKEAKAIDTIAMKVEIG